MQKSLLQETQKIFFIGIGGIGVSAIARMFLALGKEVGGSDMHESKVTEELRQVGVKMSIGQSFALVPKDTDLIVYTVALETYEPTLLTTLKENFPTVLSYPEILHLISEEKYTIAVSGTHGKTTTTAMIAKIMLDATLDPTVIVGSLLIDQKSNFIAGTGKHFVVEACEYRKSFLQIKPMVAIVTNIDNDHLDFYKDISAIQDAFHEFVMQVPKNGYIICEKKHKRIIPILKDVQAKVVDYADFCSNDLSLKVPGKHMLDDAACALAVAHILGIDKKKAEKSLKNFSGTWRRFEYKGTTQNGIVVYDDYGHHPTEIKATLAGARELFTGKRIVVVFQPHLYSRTKLLLDDFAKSFTDADEVILLPIYAAREVADPSISSAMLVERIPGHKASLQENFADAEEYLKEKLVAGDVLFTIGAGDIYKIGEAVLTTKE